MKTKLHFQDVDDAQNQLIGYEEALDLYGIVRIRTSIPNIDRLLLILLPAASVQRSCLAWPQVPVI